MRGAAATYAAAGVRINANRDGDSASYYATAWPIGSLLASSWDVKLVKAVGEAMGDEVRQYGVDILLAPGNVFRPQNQPSGFMRFNVGACSHPRLEHFLGEALANTVATSPPPHPMTNEV